MTVSVLLGLLFSVSLSSHAGEPTQKNEVGNEEKVATYTDELIKQEFKRAREYAKRNSGTTRKVAGRVNEEAALSCSFRNLRNRIIGGAPCGTDKKESHPGLKTAEDMAQLIDEVETQYENFSDQDTKLLAAQLIAMKPFRGILYRSRGLVEKHKLAHSLVITALRMGSTGVNIYLPDPNWKAGIRYIADPYVGILDKFQITDDETFNRFISTELRSSVIRFYNRINALNFENHIRFDSKVLFASANFTDDEDRYFSLGYPEKMAMLGATRLTLASIEASRAYQWKGFFQTVQNIAQIYGFDSYGILGAFNLRGVKGATAKTRVEAIRDAKDLGRFIPGSEMHTQEAYKQLRAGIVDLKAAWLAVDGSSDRFDNMIGIRQFVDPRAFAPFSRINGRSLDNMLALLEDREVTSAIYQGEVVKVRVKDLFGFNGQTPPNLQDFLPTEFYSKDENNVTRRFEEKRTLEDKKSYVFHNYIVDTPTKWKSEVYAKYFPLNPGEAEFNEKTIKNRAKVLNQAWGGFLLGAPLMAAVF